MQAFILYVLSAPVVLQISNPAAQLCYFFEKEYLTLIILTSFQITLCLWHIHPGRCQLVFSEVKRNLCVPSPSVVDHCGGLVLLGPRCSSQLWHNPVSATMPLSPDSFMCNVKRFRSYKATFSQLVIASRGSKLLSFISHVLTHILLAFRGQAMGYENGICSVRGRVRSQVYMS